MSLMENVTDEYEHADAQRVEAIAKTLMAEFYHRTLTEEASERTTIRAMARSGDQRSKHCISVAAVIVNYLHEEQD